MIVPLTHQIVIIYHHQLNVFGLRLNRGPAGKPFGSPQPPSHLLILIEVWFAVVFNTFTAVLLIILCTLWKNPESELCRNIIKQFGPFLLFFSLFGKDKRRAIQRQKGRVKVKDLKAKRLQPPERHIGVAHLDSAGKVWYQASCGLNELHPPKEEQLHIRDRYLNHFQFRVKRLLPKKQLKTFL